MAAAAELGRNPVSKHQIQPEYGDEQSDAERECRTRPARLNSQARTRTGKKIVFICPVQLITSRIGNLTRLIYTLANILLSPYVPENLVSREGFIHTCRCSQHFDISTRRFESVRIVKDKTINNPAPEPDFLLFLFEREFQTKPHSLIFGPRKSLLHRDVLNEENSERL